MIKYRIYPGAEKDLRELSKKYRTLVDDFSNVINNFIIPFHEKNINPQAIYKINTYEINLVYPEIYVLKKFPSRSLKGRGCKTGLRLLYAYFPYEKNLDAIEIYAKGDQNDWSEDRLRNYKNWLSTNPA